MSKRSKEETYKCEVEFGRPLRDLFFGNLNPTMSICNHGSFGAPPRPVLDKKRALQDLLDSSPDEWFRYRYSTLWSASLASLARYMRVDVANVLIGENTTECINAILKSIQFNAAAENEVILTTTINYGAILNAIEYTSKYRYENGKVLVHKIEITFPLKGLFSFYYSEQSISIILNQSWN